MQIYLNGAVTRGIDSVSGYALNTRSRDKDEAPTRPSISTSGSDSCDWLVLPPTCRGRKHKQFVQKPGVVNPHVRFDEGAR